MLTDLAQFEKGDDVQQAAGLRQRARDVAGKTPPAGARRVGHRARQLRQGVRQPDVGPPVRPRAEQGAAVDDFSSNNESSTPNCSTTSPRSSRSTTTTRRSCWSGSAPATCTTSATWRTRPTPTTKYDPYFARMPLKAHVAGGACSSRWRSPREPRRRQGRRAVQDAEGRLDAEADRRTSATTRGTRSTSTAPSCRRC